MALDRAQLITDATAYMHRADLPWDTFIDRANNRVGQDFRTTANTVLGATLTSASNYLLPDDFKEALAVSAVGSGGTYALQPISNTQGIDYGNPGGGMPYGYYIAGGYMGFAPATTSNVKLAYYAALQLIQGGTSTNLLLQTYFSAYLWYVLFQASLFIQDREAVGEYLKLYQDEMQRANAVNRQKLQPISSVQGTTGTVAVAT